MTIAPVPAKTSANVPIPSATYFFIQDELTRGRGESKAEGNAPSGVETEGAPEVTDRTSLENKAVNRNCLTSASNLHLLPIVKARFTCPVWHGQFKTNVLAQAATFGL